MPTISAVIKYATNIDELRRELKAGTDQLVVLEKAAERTVRNLGGEGLIRAAHNAAAAVQTLGGATKLTGAEQDKVNSLLTRAIEKYAALGQTAPAALHELAAATKRVEEPTSRLDGFINDLGKNIISTAAGFLSAQAIIGGVSRVVNGLTQFVSESVQAYAAQESAVKKMTTALQAQGQATPHVISQYKDLASQFQRTTVFSDELINEMEALLVQVGNVMPSQMESALKAATDLASGLGVDLRTATLLVGKAFEGETGTLKRYGIVIDEAKLKTEGATAVMDAIQAKFGGQAQAEVETYAGRVKQLANAWDEVKESAGEIVVSNPIIEAAIRVIKDRIDGSTVSVDDHTHSWSNLLRQLNVFGKDAPNLVARFVRSLEDAADASNRAAAAAQFTADHFKPVASHVDAATVAAQRHAAELKKQEQALKDAQQAAKDHAKAIKDLAESYSGAKAIRSANDAIEAVNKNLRDGHTIAEMSEEQQIALNKAVTAGIEVYQREGREVPPALLRVQKATQGIIDVQEDAKLALDEWADAVRRHNEEYKAGEQATVDALEAIDKERIDNAKAQLDDYAEVVKRHQEAQKKGEEDTLRVLEENERKRREHVAQMRRDLDNLSETLMRVGGVFKNFFGDILSGAGQAIKGIRDLRSATTDLGRALGGINFGLSFLQAGVAFLERDTLTASFVKGVTDAYGGLENFKKEALAAGVSVERLFSTRSLTTFKREFATVEAAMKRYRDISAQILAKQNEQARTEQEILQKTTAALEKYGLTWRDAGREFQDAHLDEGANELYEDMQLLQRAGVDNAVIFGRMHDKIVLYLDEATKYASSVTDGFGKVIQQMILTGNITDADYVKLKAYFDSAVKAGTEIPESWKPIIQTMIDLGYYTDVNNDGIIDLTDTGITFSKTTTQGFQSVVDKLQEIVEAIEDLVKSLQKAEVQAGRTRGAIAAIGTAIPRGSAQPSAPSGEPEPEDSGTDDGGRHAPGATHGGFVTPTGVQYFPRGGIVRFIPRGTDTVPAMLTPGEGVANLRGMSILGRDGLAMLNAGRIPTMPAATGTAAAGSGGYIIHNHYWQAVDEASVRNFIRRREFAEEFEREAVHNPNGIGSTIRQVAGS